MFCFQTICFPCFKRNSQDQKQLKNQTENTTKTYLEINPPFGLTNQIKRARYSQNVIITSRTHIEKRNANDENKKKKEERKSEFPFSQA